MKFDFKSITVIAPHPDDEVLGCGGLIAKFSKVKGIKINLLIVSGHLPPLYNSKDFLLTKNECLKSCKLLGIKSNPKFLEIPATKINEYPVADLNSHIDNFIKKNKSELVCVPFPDRHIDHKLVFDSCMVATRPTKSNYCKLVMCYETLSETNWNAPFIEPNFTPNFFLNINKEINKKISAMKLYNSQKNISRSPESINSLARFRGSQNGYKYAEAYQIVRLLS